MKLTHGCNFPGDCRHTNKALYCVRFLYKFEFAMERFFVCNFVRKIVNWNLQIQNCAPRRPPLDKSEKQDKLVWCLWKDYLNFTKASKTLWIQCRSLNRYTKLKGDPLFLKMSFQVRHDLCFLVCMIFSKQAMSMTQFSLFITPAATHTGCQKFW